MSKQFNDDEIIKLYQQDNDELPPKALDEAILAHASDAISKEQPVITKPNRWWQYSGIAAAMVAIAVFAPWQYYQEPDFELELKSVESMGKPALPQAKKTAKREQQVEMMELLADDVQLERIEVTGSRVERVAPEQKARSVPAPPPAIPNLKGVEPRSEFNIVLAKFEEDDKNGAEQALIELLKAKPKLHDKIPGALEGLYQELLKNGKLAKPE
ncbi:hypothetical protein AN214_02021 [Pseudoalteromonas sp. P1-9]|uniref:hypothetical protein n=1 Tax=Pseudoalteromonas sp. P1-9 TaxID=1710354 RepID=UPI0006D5DAE1|nr:hypothetical protein [Pseudoalteromonas sp. P1-9]KPV95827.1 hypothetical protein AN214_02021 [Pseudoalteromonas sp. P1-9]